MNDDILFKQFYKLARTIYSSDKQLAEALGLSRSGFGAYTRKKKPVRPKTTTIEKWCQKINISISDNIFKIINK